MLQGRHEGSILDRGTCCKQIRAYMHMQRMKAPGSYTSSSFKGILPGPAAPQSNWTFHIHVSKQCMAA